jgi:repressor LexA
VQRYLQVLRERGEIEYDGHRSIVTQFMREMLDTNRAQMGNSILCGALDDVIDQEIEHLRLPKAITGEGEFFLLRARGESMIKAGIDDGDLVLIRKQETAKQGNIVAFLYDNEQTTLKRYKQTDDAIYLCPENDSMQPIVIRGEDRAKLRIQGVATGIIKKIG